LEDGMNAQFARPPQLARAILAFKNALVADPLTFHAAYGLGNVYRQQRMHAEALDAFKNASDINPTNQDSYAQAAEMALQLRQPAEASRILNRAIARSPHNPTSIRLAALAYQAEARIPEAVAYGEFYLSLAPKNEPDRASFERWVRTLKKG
ncbi:MAG: tetratricopeptide repeat protein, partial [Kiritimatiellaeota bacterium]|nr:tetratricopeptide repeat protein [Kiritimatiellota bacterium]